MLIDTEKTIVPNWYNKEQTEECVDKKLTEEEFSEFKKWLELSELADDISESIRQLFASWLKNREVETK